MNFKEINYTEFKKDVYRHYKELFPKLERMPSSELKMLYKKNILKFVKIMDQNENGGFLIYVTTLNNPYLWFSYFAIYKEFQNKKYGSRAVQEFKNYFKNINGIYGEIEKVGFGENEKENQIREKRVEFWKSVGFEFLNKTIQFYGTVYTPCILKFIDEQKSDDEILHYGFLLYQATVGESSMKKHCFILNDK